MDIFLLQESGYNEGTFLRKVLFYGDNLLIPLIRPLQKKILHLRMDLHFILFSFSLFYLTLPLLIFCWGWIKWYYSLLLVGVWVWALGRLLKERPPHPVSISLNVSQMLVGVSMFFLLFAWVYFSGVGSHGFQNGDFDKHNAMLNDLITLHWPVSYFTSDQKTETIKLVYYLGFYLPAALVGKMFSYPVAQEFLFVWTLLGISLGFLWFCRLVGQVKFSYVIFFILFGGMDFLGRILLQQKFSIGTEHIEWWSDFWQYSSNSALLYWVPQHTIPGWVLTALLVNEILTRQKMGGLFLIFSLSALWSPFVMLGLIPIFLWGVVRAPGKGSANWPSLLAGGGLLSLCGLFYQSRYPDLFKNWLWEIVSLFQVWPRLLCFEVLEFGLFAFIIYEVIQKKEPEFFRIFFIGLLCLVFIPFYKFGMYNDFAMRSSIPALFLLQLAIIKFLQIRGRHKVLLAFLSIGFITGAMEITRSLRLWDYPSFGPRHVVQMDPGIAIQYFGGERSFFFTHLAAKSRTTLVIPEKLREYPNFQSNL